MKQGNNIIGVEYCCGCGGCAQKCPAHCISIEQDEDGFWKAKCDEAKCVHCGKCLKVCPMKHDSQVDSGTPECYAAVTCNKEYERRSSSGGAFSQIAQKVLDHNGTVWGCGMNSELLPSHMPIRTIDKLDILRRSKYVQSFLGNSYSLIEKSLEDGGQVLFAGTPCQVGGLKKFLGKQYDNLFLIDLVCHGVPSPGMFMKHIQYLEKKKGQKISSFEFRLKNDQPNKHYCYTCLFASGKTETGVYYKDVFFNEFYDMTSLNECCYHCPYANKERQGDLTIGDFGWGKQYHPELKDHGEISCILVNTEKGKAMLDSIRPEMYCYPTKWEYIIEKNGNLLHPTGRPGYRSHIYKEIREKGYEKWAENYYHSMRYLKKLPIRRPLVKAKIFLNRLKQK